MMFDQEAETLSREALQRLQLERLQDVVGRVYERVPFYRQLYDQAGVKPAGIKALEDIQRLPFTRKTNLRETYPFGLFAVPRGELRRLHASSGTKGKPTVVGYTADDLDVWAGLCARSLMAAGALPGDFVHNAYGYGLFTGGLGIHYGAERMGATVVPISGGNTPRQIMLLQDFAPRVVCCTPSYALYIAEVLDEMKVPRESLALEVGVFGAEPWTEAMRQDIETNLSIDAVDIYGLSEIMGPGVSIECREAKSGLHVWEDHFLPEIIDPLTGEALPDGQQGELVFTTLTKQGIPVVRYRTGDLCSLNHEPCACGRTHVRMARIKGRTDDMLIIRGVNVFPSEIESVLLAQPELAPHYQLVLTRQRQLDNLEVQVEVTEDFAVNLGGQYFAEHEAALRVSQQVATSLGHVLGLTCQIALQAPRTLARSEGKAVRVVDKREM